MDDILSWFRNSLTIMWARVQYIIGLIGAGAIVAFSGYDFTQLASMDAKAAFKMLAIVGLSGIVTELARRRTLPPAG